MPYRIAGIDVHKKMLAVVVSDVEVEGEYQFERRMFGSSPDQPRSLQNPLSQNKLLVLRRSGNFGLDVRVGASSFRR